MRLGIDIGGTFTDLALLDEATGEVRFGKTLTTYGDPTDGIIAGMREVLAEAGVQAADVTNVVHGTTLVTNAVIERKGAKTALITTAGFRDVLELGRELRYDIYDLNIVMPEPLVPRDLRVGVAERIDAQGLVRTPLAEDELARVADGLVASGVESVAVVFLHSYANPAHERRAAEVLQRRHPDLYVSLSCDVMPEIREFERTSATAMNAYVQPVTDRYLARLEGRLRDEGFDGVLHIVVSSGRRTTVEGARRRPVQLLESGPAGGTMAAAYIGQDLASPGGGDGAVSGGPGGERTPPAARANGLATDGGGDRRASRGPDLLAFDMGGTTAKASLVIGGAPEITTEFEAAHVRRFKRGSGLPVRIPVVDMIEIGAGGGSLASVNGLGLLQVGPESAGSEPGPACYGRGGTRPTVTDADLVLGYLDPGYFLGGAMTLDVGAAREALRAHVAEPLALSVEDAALGIHRVVNESMASAARTHTLARGHDPRRFTLVAFGGAGPVHAFQVARRLGVTRLLVPVGAGCASALGFLVSPVATERTRSFVSEVADADWEGINEFLGAMEAEGQDFLAASGVSDGTVARTAEMRYRGQGHEVAVALPDGPLGPDRLGDIAARFREAYGRRFGRGIDDVPLEGVTWRVVVSGPTPRVEARQVSDGAGRAPKRSGTPARTRPVRFPELDGPVDCPVVSRYALCPGDLVDGPAIIEERESTFVVGPASRVEVTPEGHLLVTLDHV